MPSDRSALTPTFQPFRPSQSGWVAYHDVAPASGPAGLAMTWRVPGEGLRWALVVDRAIDGQVTAAGRLGETQDVTEVIADFLRGGKSNRLVSESQALSLLFPSPGCHPTLLASGGLPPLEGHAALARRAIIEAELPASMRAAFLACLDHGVPLDAPLASLRSKTREREWPALAFAARNPTLAKAVLAREPRLLGGTDPTASLRERWPGMTEAHLRRLRDIRTVGHGPHSGESVGRCLGLLLSIPVDWWPKPKDWPSFEAVAGAVAAITSSCGRALDTATLIAASKGDWIAFAGRLSRAAGLGDGTLLAHSLADRGRDCGDPFRALVKDLMVPLAAYREDDDGRMRMEYAYGQNLPKGAPRDPSITAAAEAAQGLLYAGKSAPAALEISRRWHKRQQAMQAEIRGAGGEASWPVLFEGEHRVGDVGVVAIGDYASLREEGSAVEDRSGVMGLDHCVASRLPECLTGRAHILSVRRHQPDGTWERLSTCQVSVTRSGKGHRLSVTEHRGEANAAPPTAAIEAISHLSWVLQTGMRPVPPAALEARRDPLGGSIARKCGYDWRDPAELARALETWEPLLPRWARGLGPDGLVDALVERGLLPELVAEPSSVPGIR